MHFTQFSRKLSEDITGVPVARQLRCNGHLIEMTTDQIVTIDGNETTYNTIEEARQYIKKENYSNSFEKELFNESYSEISNNKVASIIKEHYDVKVTDTLIESYLEFAASKIFTIDPVATSIRTYNSFDRLAENKIDYVLDDGSIVAINNDTQISINNILQNHNDIIDYMRECQANFLSVIEQIKEQ